MKRGTKFFLVDSHNNAVGPFPWILVREWYALSLLADKAWVCEAGQETWRGLYEFPGLFTLPPSLSSPSSSLSHYRSAERFRKPSTPDQHAYLRRLGCPFATEHLDFHLLLSITSQLVSVFPDRCEPATAEQIEADSQDPNFWHSDPASAKQKAYLETRGIFLEPGATKGEAAALIDPASEAQVRRLNFYGVCLPHHLTKQYASTLIDTYICKHPETEERYQQWKRDNGI